MAEINSVRARWLFPVDGPPVENGTMEMADGRVAAIHSGTATADVDLGAAAIIPGLVNTHTHLEFSDLREPLGRPRPFTEWIRAVVSHRRARCVDIKAVLGQGFAEAANCGTSLIGDIATDGWTPEAFESNRAGIVACRELIGFRDAQIDEQLAIARQHLEQADREAHPHIVYGLSPHAPYSVHPELFRRLIDLAAEFQAPLAIHLAETRAELELLADGTGEFVDLLRDVGVWQTGVIPPGSGPIDYLQPLATLPRALVVHGNYLDNVEIEFLAQHPHLTVVYCPRTHCYFGHDDYPLEKLLDAGVSVAVGTDSRASNPDLNVWHELLYLRGCFPDLPLQRVLELGTICGASALGMADRLGSLSVGKAARWTVIRLEESTEADPYRQLFHPGNRVQRISPAFLTSR